MIEILEWLFEAANLSQFPLDLNRPSPPTEVGDNEYLLFSLLLKTHLSEKAQIKAHREAKARMVAELVKLQKAKLPALVTVGTFLFTSYESR
jgi:hypothetical protein